MSIKSDQGVSSLRMVLLIMFLALPAMAFAADDFHPLIGRWQRTDGGYVIEIHSIAPDGKIKVGYFNPHPINVEKAQASKDKKHIKFEMTLRDVGYPGSAYTLVYSSEKDVLLGYYFHAISRQYFDVLFVRIK
ncbi:MAG: hypothetical protein P8X85_21780 [Desulfobacterales bacterium]